MNYAISKKSNSIIIKFISMTIIFTIFEYIVSLVFELIFGLRWWDYTNEFLNLNGRICLAFSIVWGIGAIMFVKFIYPPLQNIINKLRKKIPKHFINVVLVIFLIITLVDFIFSIVKYIS